MKFASIVTMCGSGAATLKRKKSTSLAGKIDSGVSDPGVTTVAVVESLFGSLGSGPPSGAGAASGPASTGGGAPSMRDWSKSSTSEQPVASARSAGATARRPSQCMVRPYLPGAMIVKDRNRLEVRPIACLGGTRLLPSAGPTTRDSPHAEGPLLPGRDPHPPALLGGAGLHHPA